MDALWVFPSATPQNMKNFARLVRFALPYKVRFGLSICCAAMVALLFFTELGAVYPLLHILFDRQNPQRWIAEKIDSIEDELHVLEARTAEAQRVQAVARSGQRDYEGLKTRFLELKQDVLDQDRSLREQEGRFSDAAFADPTAPEPVAHLESLRRSYRLAEARKNELAHCITLLRKEDQAALDRRLVDLDREIENQGWWLRRYTLVQPFVNRYLPADSFKCLLLLIAMVMLGVAFKGVFLFLQEVPGRGRHAVDPLAHPQPLFPADGQPGPGELLRSGFLRADGAVHQ